VKDPPCLTDNSLSTTTAEHAGAQVPGVHGERDTATRSTGLGSGLGRDRSARVPAAGPRPDRGRVPRVARAAVLADSAAATAQGGHGLRRVVVDRSRRCSRPIHLAGLDAVLALHESAEDAILRSRE
jgi:hypothetical protein